MKPLVVGNWKMNTSLADASVLATLIRNQLHEVRGVDVVLCPPFIWLQEVASILEVSAPHIYLGAQDCYPEKSGAYTGEVSVEMLRDLCKFVIVGHSERREYFKESIGFVNDKLQAVLHADMTPVLCVGEKVQTDSASDEAVHELRQLLSGIQSAELERIVIAYEPIWSISTRGGGQATGEYVEVVAQKIKKNIGSNVQVLYGGNVNPENAQEFLQQPGVDGVLVGSASLRARDFVSICQLAGEHA